MSELIQETIPGNVTQPSSEILKRLTAIVGETNLLHDPSELLVYECDGYVVEKKSPDIVVFPESTEQVVEIVKTEEKCLYLDLIVLTQGFSDPLSVLGIEIWGKMLEALKGDSGLIDRGRDGTVLNVEGRQYLHLSNLMKAMGTGMGLWGLKQYDTPTRQIFDSIDLKRDYLPQKQPAASNHKFPGNPPDDC